MGFIGYIVSSLDVYTCKCIYAYKYKYIRTSIMEPIYKCVSNIEPIYTLYIINKCILV